MLIVMGDFNSKVDSDWNGIMGQDGKVYKQKILKVNAVRDDEIKSGM